MKASGGTGGDGVACLKVVNTENSCTIKNECTEHVKMVDVTSNNVASTLDTCGNVITTGSRLMDPAQEREWKDQTNCCVNKAVKVSADSKKTADEAWAAKHAKCPACFKQTLTEDGKYCKVQNLCPNAIKLILPGGSSGLIADNRKYEQPSQWCYGRCPEPYVPVPACLALVQDTDQTCTFTNNCATELEFIYEDSNSGASVGAGETARYGGKCATVKVKNDIE